MKVALRKIGKTPLDFEIKSDKITFKGYLEYDTGKLILLNAKLSGKINTDCDVCADEFELDVDEDIELYISDGIYDSKNENLMEVVESMNSMADLDEILASEVELIKSDYHSCQNCENKI
jgi:hypothetical protein